MAVPSFVNSSLHGILSRTNIVVGKPVGTVDGHILIFVIGIANVSGGTPPSMTPPAGLTQIGSKQTITAGANTLDLYMYWKRAASEGTGYTFTHASTLCTGACLAYSGCVASGSPIGTEFSTNTGSGTTATALGVTTPSNDNRLVYAGANLNGSSTLSPPTGMTERADEYLYIADVAQTTAGASGNKTQTQSASNPWAANLIALKSLADPSGTVNTGTLTSAAVGTFTVTGKSRNKGTLATSATGSFTALGKTKRKGSLTSSGLASTSLGGHALAMSPLTTSGSASATFGGHSYSTGTLASSGSALTDLTGHSNTLSTFATQGAASASFEASTTFSAVLTSGAISPTVFMGSSIAQSLLTAASVSSFQAFSEANVTNPGTLTSEAGATFNAQGKSLATSTLESLSSSSADFGAATIRSALVTITSQSQGTFDGAAIATGQLLIEGISSELFISGASAQGSIAWTGTASMTFYTFSGEIVVPPERTASLSRENRTATLSPENRTVSLQSGNRTIIV